VQGRFRKAPGANRVVGHGVGKRTLAPRAAGMAGNGKAAPAPGADPFLHGYGLAAQRAARREDEIYQGSDGRVNPHGLLLALAGRAGQAAAMTMPTAPEIFAPRRRAAIRARMEALQKRTDAARFLLEDVAEDVAERLGFLRHPAGRMLVLGDPAGVIGRALGVAVETADFPLEQPWPAGGFDTIVSAFAHDTADDLPGALIHTRRALAPGGLALVTMLGAGSLPALRGIMLEADGERPSPRIHPQVDVRAGAQLLQRAGFADPVADSRPLAVRYGALARLVGDLRAQGLSNSLARSGPPLGKEALARAETAFAAAADAQGRVTERFELLTLSGWAISK